MASALPQSDQGCAGTDAVAGGAAGFFDSINVNGLVAADRALEQLDRAARAVGEGRCAPGVFVWRTARALVVTRADARLPRFAHAGRRMASRGWPVSVRASGGGPCAVGPGTVQIALLLRRPGGGASLHDVYDVLARFILAALAEFGVEAEIAPVRDAFCSGRYDIAVGPRKIAGLAQQWHGPAGRGGYVIAAASVIVDEDPASLAAAVNDFVGLCGGAPPCCADAITTLAREAGEGGGGADLTARFSDRLRLAGRDRAQRGASNRDWCRALW